MLQKLTSGKPYNSAAAKLVPTHDLYQPGSWRTIHRNGINLKLNLHDYMAHFIYFDFRDPALLETIINCKTGDHVIDIGGNIGYYALSMAAAVGESGSVTVFEPDPLNYARCTENIGLNQFRNIQVHNLGLGETTGTVSFERGLLNSGANRVAEHGTDSIRIVTLDSLEKELPNPVKLIKIDVEGYELKVLRGGEDLIRKYHPVLIIELNNSNLLQQGDSTSAVLTFLRQCGYTDIRNLETRELVTGMMRHTNHFDVVALKDP